MLTRLAMEDLVGVDTEAQVGAEAEATTQRHYNAWMTYKRQKDTVKRL